MGKSHVPLHTKFRQEMLQRDNPTKGDNLQISSTKRAYVECMFLPHRLRSLHQEYFSDLIDQHDQHSVPTIIHVNEIRSQQSARAACTQWSVWRCAVRRRRRATPYFFSTSWYLTRVT